jgi:antitoxin ChpS
MAFATVQRLGETLVMVVPAELQKELSLTEGSRLEMQADHGKVSVRRRKYTLQELLDQCDYSLPMSEEEREWLDAPAVGRELI